MKRKNNELFSESLVGVFVAVVLVVLFYFTVIISGRELFTGRQRTFVNIKFMDVGGLKVRDSVRVRGVGVGEIANLKFEIADRRLMRLQPGTPSSSQARGAGVGLGYWY